MRELGKPDWLATSDLLRVGDVLLELGKIGAVPVDADKVDVRTEAAHVLRQERETGSLVTLGGSHGGRTELGLALEGRHVRVPAVNDLLHGHLASTLAGRLLGLVEGEQVGAAGVNGLLGVGGPAGEGGVLVVVKHRHELHARGERSGGLAPVVTPADGGGLEEVGQARVLVGETTSLDVAGRGSGGSGGRGRGRTAGAAGCNN